MCEEWVIKLSEKESLLKSFILFFIVIEAFLLFIFYQYEKIEEEHLKENIFLEMKNYSFFFDDERFDIDIVEKQKNKKPYELYLDKDSLYILVPMPSSPTDMLKIYYPKQKYMQHLDALRKTILFQFLLLTFIALVISLLFSFYTLSPMRRSLKLLETFIKDIIHDLNTPITSILINLKMMDAQNEEVESITRSTKTISMLHNNLNAYLEETKHENEKFKLQEVVNEQVSFFAPMYDYLQWNIDIEDLILKTDKHAFSRILYNLLSNACKYNTPEGFITVKTEKNTLTLSNQSYGIKQPSKVFDRFYKESDRGLGIGLHIVEVLCKQLNIEKTLTVKENIVKVTLHLEQVTLD
jgi:signal transduction histidine kinase